MAFQSDSENWMAHTSEALSQVFKFRRRGKKAMDQNHPGF
jgi:hypothetical protein